MAKYDYCDSIDIAGSTIVILSLLWTTIAILLRCYCLKHLCLFEGENLEYSRTFLRVWVPIFVWKQQKNFSILLKFTYLAEMIVIQQHIHPIAILLSFCVQPNNFKVKIPMSKKLLKLL